MSEIDLVQAVGLAGRAVMRDQHHVDVLVQPLRLAHLGLGQGIVQIDADEVMRVLVAHQPRVRRKHRKNDVVLLPARHHDGDGALGQLLENLHARQFLGLAVRRAHQPAAPVQQVHDEIVDAGNRDDHTRDQHQNFDDIEILKDEGGGLCHLSGCVVKLNDFGGVHLRRKAVCRTNCR